MTANFKLAIGALLVMSLIGFYTYQMKVARQAGYDKAQAELFEQYQIDLSNMLDNKNHQLDIAVAKRDKWQQIAIKLQSRKPVTVEVQKIVEKNIISCPRIDGLTSLLKPLQENFTY